MVNFKFLFIILIIINILIDFFLKSLIFIKQIITNKSFKNKYINLFIKKFLFLINKKK